MKDMKEQIQADISANPIILFMKGSKQMPLCGFSARVVDVLKEMGVEFVTRDVLQDDDLRQAIKDYSNWPTLPQLYIKGKFIGGCDIVLQLHENGELAKLI